MNVRELWLTTALLIAVGWSITSAVFLTWEIVFNGRSTHAWRWAASFAGSSLVSACCFWATIWGAA